MAAAGGGGVPPQRELTDALRRGDNPEALPTREPAATEETNEEAKSEEEMNDGQSTPRTEPPLAREGETPLQYAKIRVLLRGVRRLSSSLRIVGHLELPLDTIFTRAVAHTERVYATELDSCAWESFKLLLPTIVEAQAILLEEELSRCRSVAQRRGGRACAVRFRCFDLSTLDPPVMHLTGSQQAEERLLQVLLRLMGAQHLWMMNTPAAVQATTCRCFASSLRALAMDIDASDAAAAPPKAEMPTPHNEAAAANQEDSASDSSFRAGGTGGAAAALGRLEGGESSSGGNDGQAFSPLPRQGALAADFYADGFELLAEGELLLENRIRQLVCSLLRFHLHKVFDRGVGGLEVTEKGELQLRAPSARSASFPVSPVCSSWPVPKRPCEKKLSPRTLAKNSEGVPAPWKDVPSALGSPSSFGLRPAAPRTSTDDQGAQLAFSSIPPVRPEGAISLKEEDTAAVGFSAAPETSCGDPPSGSQCNTNADAQIVVSGPDEMCRAGEVTDERGARDDAPCTWTRDDDQKTPDMHTIEDSATHEEKRRRMKLTTIDSEDLQMQEKSSIPQPSLPRPGGMESDELNCAKKQPKSALEKGRHALRAAEDATAPCVEDLKADPSGPVAVDASQEADSAMAGSRIGGKEVKMEDYSEEPKPYSGESTGRAAATETCIPRLYSDGIPRMYSDGQCNGSTGSTEYGAFPLILDVSAIPVVEEGALDDDAWSETGASAAEGLASAMASPQGAGKGCAACLGRHRPHTCGRGLSLSVSKTSGSARRKGAGTTAAVNANAAYALPKRTGSSSPKRSSIPTTAHTAEDNSSVGSTSPVQKPRASTPRKPPPPAATQGQGAPTARKGWYRRERTPDSSTGSKRRKFPSRESLRTRTESLRISVDSTSAQTSEYTSGSASASADIADRARAGDGLRAAKLASGVASPDFANDIIVPLPCGRGGGLLKREHNTSLAALLSHAIVIWEQHFDFVHCCHITQVLSQNDLYARIALQELPLQEQHDLLCWAEAFQVLRAISDGGLLNNYAAKAPANWKALHSLTQLAVECSFAEEARFRLLVNPLELRHLLAAVEPAANKLCRLLQAGGDAMLGMAMDNSIAGIHLESRKTRLERKQSWEEDAKQVELVRIVRIRFHNKVRSFRLDWDEIADSQRKDRSDAGSYSPPRDRKGGYARCSRS